MTTTSSRAPRTQNPRQLLIEDHRRLEGVFRKLLASFAAKDHEAVQRFWTDLDSGLCNHFRAEEENVLPRFREVNPEEAAKLANEHDGFRKQLAALGVEVDLHVVNLAMAEAFIASLRDHAHREDTLMYQWAELHLQTDAMDALRLRIASEG